MTTIDLFLQVLQRKLSLTCIKTWKTSQTTKTLQDYNTFDLFIQDFNM